MLAVEQAQPAQRARLARKVWLGLRELQELEAAQARQVLPAQQDFRVPVALRVLLAARVDPGPRAQVVRPDLRAISDLAVLAGQPEPQVPLAPPASARLVLGEQPAPPAERALQGQRVPRASVRLVRAVLQEPKAQRVERAQ